MRLLAVLCKENQSPCVVLSLFEIQSVGRCSAIRELRFDWVHERDVSIPFIIADADEICTARSTIVIALGESDTPYLLFHINATLRLQHHLRRPAE